MHGGRFRQNVTMLGTCMVGWAGSVGKNVGKGVLSVGGIKAEGRGGSWGNGRCLGVGELHGNRPGCKESMQ